TIKSGERVAITGPSGSGKSTIINMLPRFLTPTSGSITIGGSPASELPLSTIRSSMGIAFQEVFLFNATIYENLRYARESATLEEIEAACALTGADKVVDRLPDGYDTRLSDHGIELSRGEKQRITLARALLKDAPILIFDEATASVDLVSSHTIMESISTKMDGKTIIMITHETSLLQLADRVLYVRDGRVCFNGTPDEFVAQGYGTSLRSPLGSPIDGEMTPKLRERRSKDRSQDGAVQTEREQD
ncbi:MAG: ABC transporter ATP-binding protein, partial [Phycisphaerales bacterium]|nr:ABC transporter ATP-binding protein [Phycisphaerales bacterium]